MIVRDESGLDLNVMPIGYPDETDVAFHRSLIKSRQKRMLAEKARLRKEVKTLEMICLAVFILMMATSIMWIGGILRMICS